MLVSKNEISNNIDLVQRQWKQENIKIILKHAVVHFSDYIIYILFKKTKLKTLHQKKVS